MTNTSITTFAPGSIRRLALVGVAAVIALSACGAQPSQDATAVSQAAASSLPAPGVDFCTAVDEYSRLDASTRNIGLNSGRSADEERQRFADVRRHLSTITAAAPEEIRDSAGEMLTMIERLDEFYAGYDYDERKVTVAMTSDAEATGRFAAAVGDDTALGATTEVVEFTAKHCGLDVGAP